MKRCKESKDFLIQNKTKVIRILQNLEYHNVLFDNLYDEMISPLQNNTILDSDLIGMKRAMEVRPLAEQEIIDYRDASGQVPDLAYIREQLEEQGVKVFDPSCAGYDWMIDAIIADEIDRCDSKEEEAQAALKEVHKNFVVLGPDASRDQRIKIGRRVGVNDYRDVHHFDTYSAIAVWADANHARYSPEEYEDGVEEN